MARASCGVAGMSLCTNRSACTQHSAWLCDAELSGIICDNNHIAHPSMMADGAQIAPSLNARNRALSKLSAPVRKMFQPCQLRSEEALRMSSKPFDQSGSS